MAQKNNLPPRQRLIVAADPPRHLDGDDAYDWTMRLAGQLAGTGVIIKVNTVLRDNGYRLIHELNGLGLLVFADLKLNDIPNTMANDGRRLHRHKPYIVTAMCSAGVAGLSALKRELPDTEVLGVTTLTSLKEEDTQAMFGCSIQTNTLRMASQAALAHIDGLISAPTDLAMLRESFGEDRFSLNTPGVRPAWAQVRGDDQNAKRTMTPAEAIRAGADRIVVGRPITQAEDRHEAVQRTLDEIAEAAA